MTTEYHNFTDDDVPPEAPHTADHLAPCHAFDHGALPSQSERLIIAEFPDKEDGFERADGRWYAMDIEHTVEVRP